jgi:hypothetical protein
MADITYANTLVDGATVTAAALNENTYNPDVAATSLAEINGLLNRANMNSADWLPRSGLIRGRALGNGRMVGSTMNLDFLSVLNPADADDTGAYVPVPGAAITFYLPRIPSACWVTWQLISAVDMGHLVNEPVTKFRLLVDGTRATAFDRQQVPSVYASGRAPQHDRIYSGSYLFTPGSGIDLGVGWNTVSIAHWGAGYEIRNAAEVASGGTDSDFGGMCRFRTRNMKVFWLR